MVVRPPHSTHTVPSTSSYMGMLRITCTTQQSQGLITHINNATSTVDPPMLQCTTQEMLHWLNVLCGTIIPHMQVHKNPHEFHFKLAHTTSL